MTDDKGGTATATATVTVAGVGMVASPIDKGEMDLVAVGTAGNDTIAIRSVPTVKAGVRVVINNVTSAAYSVSGRIIALGGAGDDVISTTGTTQSAWFYGGTGNDKLTGAAANDVLVGGAGSDQLKGNGGRNLLFGGDGADILTGSGSADMLVADATTYDVPTPANQSAVAQVQDNWVGRKVKAIRVSAKPGGPTISADTVTPDGSADVLIGRRSDWFVGDFTFSGGTTTFSDGRHAKPGQLLTPKKSELVTDL